MLDKLNSYLFELTLEYLTPCDYVQLCLTSQTISHSTLGYLKHCSDKEDRYQSLDTFYALNLNLLLPREQKLFLAVEKLSEYKCRSIQNNVKCDNDVKSRGVFTLEHMGHLPLYREISRLLDTSPDTRRVSVARDSQVFSYLGDRDHVYVEYCEVFKRNVVYLREISWLLFSIELPIVPVGRYRVRLHFQIRKGVEWKGDKPMIVRIMECYSNETVCQYFVHPKVWRELAEGRVPCLKYNEYNDTDNFHIVPSPQDSWFYMVLDNVVIEEHGYEQRVKFYVDDRENVFWKSGKSWDFVEIMRLS